MDYAQHTQEEVEGLVPAALAHLVIGAPMYLGDPRRTPVTVASHDPATASFTVLVADFEDAGTEWTFALWDVEKFLVTEDAQKLTKAEEDALQVRWSALQQTTYIAADATKAEQTQGHITGLQSEIGGWLARSFDDLPTDADALILGKDPCRKWSVAFEKYMSGKSLMGIDRGLVAEMSSNPNAGEVLKGHRIVMAEMGLVPFEGHVVRDQRIFEHEGTKAKRYRHIVTRLAFMRAMLSRLDLSSLPLYRTIYSNTTLDRPVNNGFVSATFSEDVAASLFKAGRKTRVAATFWQRIPAQRLFMSYFETPELSRLYQEAEAVLLFEPSEQVF